MIIFGTRVATRLLATLRLLCPNCRQQAAHHVTQRVTKFTLFFVPLFPISRSTSTTCTYCGYTAEVPKDQVEPLVAQAAQGQPQPAPPGWG